MNKFDKLDTYKTLRNKRYTSITTGHVPAFPTTYVMVFSMFNAFMREVIVRFVDIDGIFDHHCLDFFFLNTIFFIFNLFKEYLKLLNRLYDITWFGSVYA
jgi:hypothetical protein